MNGTDSALPVSHSQPAADALLRLVEQRYALDSPLRCVLLRSWTNDIYEIATASARYVLKVYRASWKQPAQVAWEVELQQHLANQDRGVVPVIPLRDSQLYGTLPAPEGERCYALFRYAAGAKPEPPFTPDLNARFGHAVARLHQASNGYPAPDAVIQKDVAYLFDEPHALIRPFLKDRPGDLDLVLRVAHSARTRLMEYVEAELDWGVCHGDLSLDNLHVTDEGRIIIYDFDLAGLGWRAFDICGVYWWVLQGQPEMWDAFLRAYTEIRALSDADVAAVPAFWGAYLVRLLADTVTRWTKWAGLLWAEEHIRGILESMRSWEAEVR